MRTERLLIGALAIAVVALALRPGPDARATALDESFSVAVCSLPTIVNELMASERFEAEREDLAADFEDASSEIEERLERISEDASEMEPDDPAMGAIREEFNTLRAELFRVRSEFEGDTARLQARQFKEAYLLVRASANAVAEDLGYDFVISSASPDSDDELSDTNATQLLGQLSRRPVIRFPDEHDITDDVRDDLNL